MDDFMHKKTVLFFLFSLFASQASEAAIHPVVSVGYGLDYVHTGAIEKTFMLEAPFQDTYFSSASTFHGGVGNVFVGMESQFHPFLSAQFGLSYTRPATMNVQGSIWQFGTPQFYNKGYQYYIQSQQAMLEAKLLTTIATPYPLHPYFMLGLGESFNKSFGYTEIPLAPYASVNPAGFARNTSHSFVYMVGIGLDVNVAEHVRVGASYRQTELGDTHLGTMPNQTGSTELSYGPLRTNEVLVNLTYVG
jgi:opacity protein-like surface antigen